MLKVGDTVFVVSSGRDKESFESTITKVGRKFIYSTARYGGSDIQFFKQVTPGGYYSEVGSYREYQLYPSKADWEQKVYLERVRCIVKKYFTEQQPLTHQQCLDIAKIVGLELPSSVD